MVTGGAGYIGVHTVIELMNLGYHPIVLDDFRNSDAFVLDRIQLINSGPITVLNVDVSDAHALEAALAGYSVDAVIHFAAYKAVGESMALPLKYYYNNVVCLIHILEWAQKNAVKNFIFSSSCTVYGEPQGIKEVREEMSGGFATSPYGNTKVVGERILIDFKKSGVDMNILALRYFNPIGAHESGLVGELPLGRPNNLLPFITQTAMGIYNELTVFGKDYPTLDGTCVRDYIHVTDLAKAHVKGVTFLEKQSYTDVQFINVGTGQGTSVLQLIGMFEQVSGHSLKWKFGARRPGDVAEIFANADNGMKRLDWKAERTIEDAIRDAWRWELNYRKIIQTSVKE